MKLKSLVFICCMGLFSFAFAGNHHFNPQAKTDEMNMNMNMSVPGNCDIEIINDSFDDVRVYGRFEDGTLLTPFIIKHWGPAEYVSLYYYGACHAGMDFYIETVDGKHKYNGYTPVGKTIKITSW